jgi:hypothetical protein
MQFADDAGDVDADSQAFAGSSLAGGGCAPLVTIQDLVSSPSASSSSAATEVSITIEQQQQTPIVHHGKQAMQPPQSMVVHPSWQPSYQSMTAPPPTQMVIPPSPSSTSSSSSIRLDSPDDGLLAAAVGQTDEDPHQASYLDIATIRCLLVRNWAEDGVAWAVQYLLQRLTMVPFR